MFQIQSSDTTIDACFTAQLAHVDRLWKEVKVHLALNRLDDVLFSVNLLLREALNNAIRHGCGLDDTQTVTFSLAILPDHIELDVQDTGTGFDWRRKFQTLETDGPDCMACSGRGLYIMGLYASDVRYNDAGNALHLKIPLSGKPVK